MSAPKKHPAFRLDPEGTGYARNRSITMPVVMWEHTDEAAAQDGVKFSEWARRVLAAELARRGFEGYTEDGDYPADRKPT